ncbi:hypothetical protein SteCoe_37937 [Stentor coeruleus]|nr:hypothetical protein SteCoe_37937 [Stentor coeruleus]
MDEKGFEAIDTARQFCLKSDHPNRFNIINNTYQNLIKGFSRYNKKDAIVKFIKDYIDFLTKYMPENSQNLYESYLKIAEYNHKEKDFKNSIIAASKALEYAEKTKNDIQLIHILQFLSGLYVQIGDFSLVINYLERLKPLLNDQSKQEDWISFYSKAFLAYKKMNCISETIDSGNKLISAILASEKPDYGAILTTQITIAETYASINNLDESFKYVKASEDTALKGQGENGYYHSKALHHIGLVYKLKGEYDKANDYLTKALAIILRIFGNKNMEAFNTLDMLVSVSYSTKNWKDLVEYAQKRSDLLEENKKHTEVSMISTYLALGEGFAGQKNITIAKYNFEKLREYCLMHGKTNDALIAEARIKQLKEE